MERSNRRDREEDGREYDREGPGRLGRMEGGEVERKESEKCNGEGMEGGGDRRRGERNKWQHLPTLQVISKIKVCATTCTLVCLKQHCGHSDEFKVYSGSPQLP